MNTITLKQTDETKFLCSVLARHPSKFKIDYIAWQDHIFIVEGKACTTDGSRLHTIPVDLFPPAENHEDRTIYRVIENTRSVLILEPEEDDEVETPPLEAVTSHPYYDSFVIPYDPLDRKTDKYDPISIREFALDAILGVRLGVLVQHHFLAWAAKAKDNILVSFSDKTSPIKIECARQTAYVMPMANPPDWFERALHTHDTTEDTSQG